MNQLAKSSEITPKLIDEIRRWNDLDAATFLDERMRELELLQKRSFIEIGIICHEVSERGLYSKLTDPTTHQYFTSFDRWLISAAPVSRSGGYSAMKAVKELKDISVDDLNDMPRCNITTMTKLSSKIRRKPEIIKAAKTQSENDFRKTIERDHPDQAIESLDRSFFNFERSQRGVVNEAIDAAMCLLDLPTREAALEAICQEFIWAPCQLEGATDLTIGAAYDMYKKEGR